jgi:putative transposase
MKGKRFSEEQIIGVLKEGEAGVKTAELCRRHGITGQTFYRWFTSFSVQSQGVSPNRTL